jgi:hypothetical protein
VAVFALLVGTLLAGLVWHATRLDPVDAWVMRWQVLAHSHASGAAAITAWSRRAHLRASSGVSSRSTTRPLAGAGHSRS